ncbi:MAG: hypothetical protein AAGG44_07120 [Planctomycetota bacterium]
MDTEINVLAMMKGEERYVFLFDDKNRVETLRTLGRYAADPELSFTWYDAAVMSKKIRDLVAELEGEQPSFDSSSPYKSPRPSGSQPRFSFSPEEDII